jgi:hypothetical protein
MRKWVLLAMTVLAVSSCSIHNRRGIMTLENGDIPKTTQVVAYTAVDAIGANVAALPDAAEYKFGKVVALQQKDAVSFYNLKEKDKECVIDIKKNLKIDLSKCSDKASDCAISLSLPRKCDVRPLFVIDPIFSKEELANCKVKATITGLLALKTELADQKGKTTAPSFIDKLKEASIAYTIGTSNGAVMSIKVKEGLDVCLEKFIQPSQYGNDVADWFLDKEVLNKVKSINSDAAGSFRDDREPIAVFKVWFKVIK